MTQIQHNARSEAGRDLCRVVTGLHARGWAQGTGGNFSVTLGRDPLRILITQSGLDKGLLRPEKDLVLVDADGRPVNQDDSTNRSSGRPSAETLLHCVLAERVGAGSTLHTHSVAATLLGEHFLDRAGFTLTGYEMQKGLEGITSHEARVHVPVLANSQDMVALSAEVVALLDAKPGIHGFLLAGHGLYTWGETLEQAKRHVEIFEFLMECAARRTSFRPLDGD